MTGRSVKLYMIFIIIKRYSTEYIILSSIYYHSIILSLNRARIHTHTHTHRINQHVHLVSISYKYNAILDLNNTSYISTQRHSRLHGRLIRKWDFSIHNELHARVRNGAQVDGDNQFQREGPVTLNDQQWVRIVCDLEIWTSKQSIGWSRWCEVVENRGEKVQQCTGK